MKKLIVYTTVLFSTLFFTTSVYSQSASDIVGKWKGDVDDKHIEVEIYLASDGGYYGKVINDNSKSSKNGIVVLKNLKYNKTSKNYKGILHPADANVELEAIIKSIDKDHLQMVNKKFLISKTINLTRIK